MKRKLTLISACVAVLFLCTLAVAGGGGPAANKNGKIVEQKNGPPDETPVKSEKEGGGWGKICKGDCPADGCMWNDVCKGECLSEPDGCIIEKGPIPSGDWQETLLGGGEGQEGNLIEAWGKKVWALEGATLDEVLPVQTEFSGWPACYLTTYTGGTFTLDLPCHENPLVDPDVIVYNYTCKSEVGDFTSFMVYFQGELAEQDGEKVNGDAADRLCFEAVGHYAGVPFFEEVPDGTDTVMAMGGAMDAVTLVLKNCPAVP